MEFKWSIWGAKWWKRLWQGTVALALALVIAAVTELKESPHPAVWFAPLAQAIFIIVMQVNNWWKHTHG